MIEQVSKNDIDLYHFPQVSETENIRKNLAIERSIEEGCDIILDVDQVYVRQGKTPLEALTACFPKESPPSFTRRPIEFPQKSSHLFASEDSEESIKYRSRRSHSTVSYLQREPHPPTRRRLSSIRQTSLGNGSCFIKPSVNLGSTTLSPPQPRRLSDTRRLSEDFRTKKRSVRINDESFDEGEESVVAATQASQIASIKLSPSSSPSSSPEDNQPGPSGTRRLSSLTPVPERTSIESASSEDGHNQPT